MESGLPVSPWVGRFILTAGASDHLRASAQALLLVCTSGLGALLGNLMAGEIVGSNAAR